jgi:hypothetical protein
LRICVLERRAARTVPVVTAVCEVPVVDAEDELLAGEAALEEPVPDPELDRIEEPELDGEDPCDGEPEGIETFGVDTDGALIVGVETVGVCTDGVETDGTVMTGVDTVGVLTTGTDGTVTDGTVTDGTVTVGVLTLGSWALGTVVPAIVAAPLASDWTASAASRMIARRALMSIDRRFMHPVTNASLKTCYLRAPIACRDGHQPDGQSREERQGWKPPRSAQA